MGQFRILSVSRFEPLQVHKETVFLKIYEFFRIFNENVQYICQDAVSLILPGILLIKASESETSFPDLVNWDRAFTALFFCVEIRHRSILR